MEGKLTTEALAENEKLYKAHRHNRVSRYVAEQRNLLSKIQGKESRAHCAPQIIGELDQIRWLLLPIIVILTLDKKLSKTGSSNWQT